MKKTKVLVTTSVLILVFVMISFYKAESATLYCNSCADCTSKVQSASAGDIIMLAVDLSAESERACIDFNGDVDGIDLAPIIGNLGKFDCP